MAQQLPQPVESGAPHPQANVIVSPKSKFLAAVLAFFFGTFGVHNFYLGYSGIGFLQLALGIVGYLTTFILVGFFILVPLGVWVIVEIIMLLVAKSGRYSKSANGLPLA